MGQSKIEMVTFTAMRVQAFQLLEFINISKYLNCLTKDIKNYKLEFLTHKHG